MRPSPRLQLLLLSPMGLVLGAVVVIPSVILLFYSFYDFLYLERVGSAGIENYQAALTDPSFRVVAGNTLLIAGPTSLISLVGGYCLAYYMTTVGSKMRGVFFGLVITGFIASYLVRVYAWRTLLGSSGLINSGLEALGIIEEPLQALLFTRASAVLAQVNLFLPLAALILFVALLGVPTDVIPAARDLGASRFEVLRRITLPLTGPAILNTFVVVFFVSAGDYVTPALVGGTSSVTIGSVIASYFGSTAKYGMGAALSFLLLIAFVGIYAIARGLMTMAHLRPQGTA